MSFDPWGRQRNADGSDDATCALPQASPTSKGFTGQEAIASLCLVNLNARLYDPTLGRFLSPDSIVPDPTDAQSYNRYAYVNNRPLSLTDPTGHQAGDPNGCILCSDYTNSDAHPEMEAYGAGPGTMGITVISMTMSAPDGFQFGTARIVVNSNGSAALDLNCDGTDCGALGTMAQAGLGSIDSISGAARALNTIALQYANQGSATSNDLGRSESLGGGTNGSLPQTASYSASSAAPAIPGMGESPLELIKNLTRLKIFLDALSTIDANLREKVLDSTVMEYRVYGGKAKWDGPWWTTEEPREMKNPRDRLALDPRWQNTMTDLATGELSLRAVESGEAIFKGPAPPEPNSMPPLKGGAPQVFIPNPRATLENIETGIPFHP
jgi:RHS repeat-associated protein